MPRFIDPRNQVPAPWGVVRGGGRVHLPTSCGCRIRIGVLRQGLRSSGLRVLLRRKDAKAY